MKTENKIRRSGGERVVFAIAFVIFAVYALSVIYAVLWAFNQSLKGNIEFFDNMAGLPDRPLFSNYGRAFRKLVYNRTTFVGMFVNSLWFAGGSAVLGTLMHCMTGYIFAKYKFRFKEAAFTFILFTITVPIVGNLPSFYKVVSALHLNDTPLFLITTMSGFTGNFLITYAYFKGIDGAYAEAAKIDGAGHIFIFFRIMLPLAAGPIFALSLLTFIAQWNNYESPILFLDRMPTLSSGLYRFRVAMTYQADWPAYYAGILMSMVPVVVLVILFGGKIMQNMTIGGIKG